MRSGDHAGRPPQEERTRRRVLAGLAAGAASAPPVDALPATELWRARRGEVRPSVKAVATTLVETAAPGRQVAPGARVVNAQYGGILATTASVLVVVDQWRRSSTGRTTAGGATLDIRLEAASPHWRVVTRSPPSPAGRPAGVR